MSDHEEKKCTTLDKVFGNMRPVDGFDIFFLVLVLIGCFNWIPVIFGYPDLVQWATKSAPGWGTFIYCVVVLCALGKAITWWGVRALDRDKKVVSEPTE